MKDIFSLLGIKQLNTTVYHPQCNGLTERFNQALKKAGSHIWATVGQISYRNTPHDAHDETGEKPSFLLFGMDCQQLLNLFELAFVLFSCCFLWAFCMHSATHCLAEDSTLTSSSL